MIDRRRQVQLTGCVLLLAGLAHAGEPERDEARAHFQQGLALVDVGRFEEAIVEFQRAQAIKSHAAVLYNIGMACAGARRYTLALTTLRAYLAGPPQELDQRRVRDAEALVAELEPKLGSLSLDVYPAHAVVSIDGLAIDNKGELPIDPGSHVVSIRADGYAPAEKSVDISAGERKIIRLRLEPVSIPRSVPQAALPRPVPAFLGPTPPVPEPDRSRIWLILSTSGTGVLLTAVTTALIIDNHARYKEWQSTQANLDRRWQTASPSSPSVREQAANDERADRIKLQDEIAVGMGVASAALLIIAGVVWLSEPDKPRVRMHVGTRQPTNAAMSFNW